MHFAHLTENKDNMSAEGEKEQQRRRAPSEEEGEEQDGVSSKRGGRREVALDPQHVLRRIRHRRLRWQRPPQLEGRRAARGNLQIRH